MPAPIARAIETVHLPYNLAQDSAQKTPEQVVDKAALKQVQTQLISSLEQLVNTVQKAPANNTESMQTATSIATNLLNVLKGLS